MDKVPVGFLQRTSKALDETARVSGQVIFVTDTKEIYLDTSDDRIKFGVSESQLQNLIDEIGAALDTINGEGENWPISEKLNQLEKTKNDLREVITAQGQDLNGVPFSQYAQYITTEGIPIATKDSLGGVIPGDAFIIDEEGHLDLDLEKVLTPKDITPTEEVQKDIDRIIGGKE